MTIYLEGLADLTDDQIKLCIGRAVRELKFFPKVSELRELAGASRGEKADAEARAAWDVLTEFVGKYVSSDVYGNYGPERGWYSKSYPRLSDRILDTVRRTGGWRAYKCMTNGDFPFVRKRFFEEYEAWAAVEQIVPSKLLTEVPKLQLVAKPMPPAAPLESKTSCPKPATIKRVLEPYTDAQLQDRREVLRQQAARLSGRRST